LAVDSRCQFYLHFFARVFHTEVLFLPKHNKRKVAQRTFVRKTRAKKMLMKLTIGIIFINMLITWCFCSYKCSGNQLQFHQHISSQLHSLLLASSMNQLLRSMLYAKSHAKLAAMLLVQCRPQWPFLILVCMTKNCSIL